jgi:hypothetical protein
MGHILPVHEAHICWPMHYRALILPPVPPLMKKHCQQLPLRAIGDAQRQPPPWSLTGGADPLATRPCSRHRRPFPCSHRRLFSCPHRCRRSLLLLPPLRMRGGEGDSRSNLKLPKPDSKPPSPDFLLPTAATPLQDFFGCHRFITPNFKARRRLNLLVRSVA